MKDNKFSIIVPCYNSEKTIEKCIDSVLLQNYKNFEIIVINDGSKDNTLSIIEKKYKNKKNVKIINKNNTGVSDSRNKGLKISTGEWILFLDSDDWLEKNTLDEINKKIIECKPDFISTALINNSDNYEKKQETINNNDYSKNKAVENIISTELFCKNNLEEIGNIRCIGGKFYKSEIIKNNNIQFFTDIVTFEDGIFNLYYIKNCEKIMIYNNGYYHYYNNPTSRMNTINLNQINENNNIIKHIIDFYNDNKHFDYKYIRYLIIYQFVLSINVIVIKHNLKEGKIIIKQEYEKYKNKIDLKNINYNNLPKSKKLVLFLCNCNLYSLLYIIYKIKMKFIYKKR